MRPTILLPFYISVYSAVIASIYFLLPLYLKGSLQFTGGQIGVLYAVLSLNAILVSFPVGVIGDRYPARILTRVGLAATAASLWGLAVVGSFWPFLAVFWGFGLSSQLFRLSLDTLLFKEDHGDTPRRLGHYNAMRMGGMMVGTLLGGGGVLLAGVSHYPEAVQRRGAAVDRPHGQTPVDPGRAHHPL